MENSRSVLSQFFDSVSVGEIDYSNCNEFTGVDYVALTPKDMVLVIAEEGCYHTNIDGDTVTVRKHRGDIRFVEIEYDSMYCVVKGVSESGNVLDMFNTCRTGFIVEYIKEFWGIILMSELEWLKQDRMIISMNKKEFIDSVVNSYNKHRANKITETKVLDNGRVVQFSNDVCSVQVFNQSIDSVIISHKYHSGERIRQFVVENDLRGMFCDYAVRTTEWVISSDFDAYWDFEELANTKKIVCSDDDVVSVMKEFNWVPDKEVKELHFINNHKVFWEDGRNTCHVYMVVTLTDILCVDLRSYVYGNELKESVWSNGFTYDDLRALVGSILAKDSMVKPVDWVEE